ncbi:MAG: MBL fold metallo-hydrolase [Nitrospinae bacterium]|nr:MBL fold metallo-hydrolase [Nitrospinota bacterium]
MKLQFWGVRGSIPAPGPDTAHFGGNTSCLHLMAEGQPAIILDAGTGIRKLGIELLRNHKDKKEIHLLFSHTHWDHIQGLPFFAPLYIPGFSIHIYGPVHYEKSLEHILDQQMEYTYFPVRVAELQAKISYHELKEESFNIGDITVRTKYLNHPVLCLGYRFERNGKAIVYCTDHEPYYNFLGEDDGGEEVNMVVEDQNNRLKDFIRGADLLVMDTQYTEEEYPSHQGWGHSSTVHNVGLIANCGIKRLAMFHHDPDRTDADEKKIVELMRRLGKDAGLDVEIFGAREGLSIEV